ncbi:MAG: isopentenyl-diphosphate Delta-isomerase [Bacteroidales bacterium]|nr:isopentenyl-diphosphate Delta-isomerase [Bacteroidales bacterium]
MDSEKSAQVILVDENDNQIGTAEKLKAHEEALLHSAVSVFIVNTKGDLLVQRRALSKYHSGGLWSNTCCTHPFPGETNIGAAGRRLMEEMGMKCKLEKLFHFTYKIKLDHGLYEHEFDHVFVGVTDEKPAINQEEVMDWKYLSFKQLEDDIANNPQNYTYWFRYIFNKVSKKISGYLK